MKKKKILVCFSYALKASLVLAGATVDSPLFTLFCPSGHWLLSVTFLLSSQWWLTHFIKFLFLNDENLLIPGGFNNITASLPPFFKPPLNLGDGTSWQVSFNYPPSPRSSLPRCLQGTPLWKVLHTQPAHSNWSREQKQNVKKSTLKEINNKYSRAHFISPIRHYCSDTMVMSLL